ncbi:MAG: PAS domain S-box protein [Desulfonatronovibrio sp.]
MPRSTKIKDEPARPVISDPHDILMNAPAGVFTSTPEGSLIYANQAPADMYGYAAPQDLLASVRDVGAELFADPKDPPAVTSLLATEGIVKNYECEHLRRDGSCFWASGSIRTVYAEDGSISHYQGFATDITERKTADNQWQDTFYSMPDLIATVIRKAVTHGLPNHHQPHQFYQGASYGASHATDKKVSGRRPGHWGRSSTLLRNAARPGRDG